MDLLVWLMDLLDLVRVEKPTDGAQPRKHRARRPISREAEAAAACPSPAAAATGVPAGEPQRDVQLRARGAGVPATRCVPAVAAALCCRGGTSAARICVAAIEQRASSIRAARVRTIPPPRGVGRGGRRHRRHGRCR
jgi:hypothetical protein